MTVAPKVLFYVQHLLGIGHLTRANSVCKALVSDGFDVTVITGGRPVPGFPDPSLRQVALPPIVAANAGFIGLSDSHGNPVSDALKDQRRDLLLKMLYDIQPDVVITETFPFGRRQMRFELMPLVEAISKMEPRPLLVSSIRDLLQEKVKPGRHEEAVATANEFFDAVMVHGDPNFTRLEDSFPLTEQLGEKVFYTGLVAPEAATASPESYDVVVSAGGGAVGGALVRAALEAAERLPEYENWAIVTGPNLAETEFAGLQSEARPGVSLFRFRQDFLALLGSAGLSISQSGYNTVCDILRAGCRSVLVPFEAGGETEQKARASKLNLSGRAKMVTEAELSADALVEAVRTQMAQDRPDKPTLDLEGAQGSARLLRQLLG